MQAVYYRDPNGREPVNDFVDGRPRTAGGDRLQDQPAKPGRQQRPAAPVPHSSQVDGQLRELRCHYGRDLYRILYQRSGNLFVLLHAMEKRTGALPQADIDIARKRFEDFRARMEQPRRPPRPAGHDAPEAVTYQN